MPPRERTSTTDRARTAVARSAQQQGNGGGQVERWKRLDAVIGRFEPVFAAAMPKGRETTQLARDMMTCLRTIKRLDECDDASLIGSLMTAAQLGLRPGVLGQCWPLPFWDSRAKHRRAQLIIGYQGYAELAQRSGLVADVIARPVYRGDVFAVDYGDGDRITHRPDLNSDQADEDFLAVYCIIHYRSGGTARLAMGRRRIEKHRDRFATARDTNGQITGPWVTDFVAMACKTVFLQLVKWAPKSPEIALAMQWDSQVREVGADGSDRMPAPDLTGPAYDMDGEVVDDRPSEGTTDAAEPATSPPPAPAETQLAAPPPDPAGPTVDAGDRPDQRQRNRLHAILGGLGLGLESRREDKLAVLSDLAGRPVDSSNDLTAGETHRAAEVLAAIHRGDEADRPLAVAEHVEAGRKRRAAAAESKEEGAQNDRPATHQTRCPPS